MLQNLASIADIVGAIGVMVSLIFVGIQVMQSNALARSAAEQKQIESMGEISRLMIENPTIADLISRKPGADMTEQERVLAVSFMTFAGRTWEALYEQYRKGQVDPQIWEAHRRMARVMESHPLNKAVWNLRRSFYSERYQQFRDSDGAGIEHAPVSYDFAAARPQPPAPKQTSGR